MKYQKKITAGLLTSLLVLTLLPSDVYAKGPTAVTTDALNFRDAGTVSARILDVIPAGESVDLLKTEDNWAQVRYENTIGWVARRFLVESDKAVQAKSLTNLKDTRLKETMDLKGTTLRTLKAGSIVALRSIQGDWYEVEYQGVTGFVQSAGWIDAPASAGVVKPEYVAPTEGKVEVYNDITVYMNAIDASRGENPVGTYKAGEYFIYKNYSGMINITGNKLFPGAWINPQSNTDQGTTAKTGSSTKKVVKTEGVTAQYVEGDSYELLNDTDTYTTADDARTGNNPVGRYSAGSYYIYRVYSGMLNITKVKGQAGAWINPETVAPAQPDPEGVVQDPQPARTSTNTITSTGSVNLRSGAGTGYDVLASIPTGSEAEMTGLDGNWVKLDYNGMKGYASRSFWNIPEDVLYRFEHPEDPDTIVATDSVNMRSGASTTYPVLTMVPAGAKAVMIGLEGNWAKIRYNDTTGYSSRSYWDIPEPVMEKFLLDPDTITSNAVVYMRNGAGTDFEILSTISAGARAIMTGRSGKWLKIEYDGQIGYSYMSYWDVPSSVDAKFSSAPVETSSGNGHTVYLDPGHMGVGKGAVSSVTGETVDENTINYQIAVLVRKLLEKRGYTVYISKDSANDPVDLSERAREANSLKTDIFVSIHGNSYDDPDSRGTIGFWAGEKQNPLSDSWQKHSKLLAQILARNVGNITGKYSDVMDTSWGFSYLVNRETNMPSTLLELGFLSNYHDAVILNSSDSQKKIAIEIADGIDEYFEH